MAALDWRRIDPLRRIHSCMEGRLVSLDAIHTQHETASQLVQQKGADYLLTLKDNQETCSKPRKPCCRVLFFPKEKHEQQKHTACTEEINRQRPEKRQLVRQEVSPAQLDFVGAAQIARLDRWRAEKNGQEPKHTQLWLVSSRAIEDLSAKEFLDASARRQVAQESGVASPLSRVFHSFIQIS